MSKAVFRGKTGRTKRHDYKAGVKFTLKRTKTVSKSKVKVEAKPLTYDFSGGGRMFLSTVRSSEVITEPIILGNTKVSRAYKKARTGV